MLCLDTHTLMELHNGNPALKGILDKEFVVAEPTLAEFYSVIYRRLGEKTAEYWYRHLIVRAARVEMATWLAAGRFREDNRKSNFSFFDAVGYIYAQEHGMQFVTGDKEFKGRPGVMFVK